MFRGRIDDLAAAQVCFQKSSPQCESNCIKAGYCQARVVLDGSPKALNSDLSLGGEVFREVLILTEAHMSKD